MIEKIVRGSLQQRLVVLVIAVALLVAGFFGVKKLSIDAFPDVTNIQVKLQHQHLVSRQKKSNDLLQFLLKLD